MCLNISTEMCSLILYMKNLSSTNIYSLHLLMLKLLKKNLSSTHFICAQIYASTTKFPSYLVLTTSFTSIHMIKEVTVCKQNEELLQCADVKIHEQIVNIGITKILFFPLLNPTIPINRCMHVLPHIQITSR